MKGELSFTLLRTHHRILRYHLWTESKPLYMHMHTWAGLANQWLVSGRRWFDCPLQTSFLFKSCDLLTLFRYVPFHNERTIKGKKWLSLRPILKQESLWCRQCSIRYNSSSPVSWDLGPCQHLSGDNLALDMSKHMNTHTCTRIDSWSNPLLTVFFLAKPNWFGEEKKEQNKNQVYTSPGGVYPKNQPITQIWVVTV